MSILYDIVFIIFSIFYIPLFLLRKRKRQGMRSRFGLYPQSFKKILSQRDNIWLHAVSVGEVRVISNIIKRLRREYPDHRLVLTTVTETGNAIAKNIIEGDEVVTYLPFDIRYIVRRAVSCIRPKILIIAETELWPNLILQAFRSGVPIVIINGRISDKSFGRYKLVRWLLPAMLNRVSLFLMQTQADREKVIMLGADPIRVRVSGNLKFDIDEPSTISDGRLQRYRDMLVIAEGQRLIIAGSTHPGEEEIIVSCFAGLIRSNLDDIRLLIAPRHTQRAPDIERILARQGLTPVRFSQLSPDNRDIPARDGVFILDTMGQLKDLYALADIVFIGGSLIKRGGQNIIEPAIFSKPVIFGPHMYNFSEMAEVFLKHKAAVMVNDKDSLKYALKLLLEDERERVEMGRRARKVIEDNRGATDITLESIRGYL